MGGSGNLVGRVVSKLESLLQGPIPYNPTHTYPRSDVHLCSSSYTPGFKQASFRLVRLCGRLQTKRSIKLTDKSKTAPAKDLERSLSFVVFRYEASKRMSKGCRCFDDPRTIAMADCTSIYPRTSSTAWVQPRIHRFSPRATCCTKRIQARKAGYHSFSKSPETFYLEP